VVRSTRQEHGGTGVPYHFLLGKYCKELYGLELGLRQMQRGERAILKILPEYLYDHPKCANTAQRVWERRYRTTQGEAGEVKFNTAVFGKGWARVRAFHPRVLGPACCVCVCV
jgi:hypothetical protein